MTSSYRFLTPVLLAAALVPSLPADIGATAKPRGPERTVNEFAKIEIKNFQDEALGRIVDLGIDLVNGRIVEVLVKSDGSLDVGRKIVAVPPLALFRDPDHQVFRLNITVEKFKTAAAIDLARWEDFGRRDRVAAAYHLFGQSPYFLESGETADLGDDRPKVALGYVERSNRLQGMPVGNHQGLHFGQVWSMILDIPGGRILNVIVLSPGNLRTKSLIPAMALSFNPARDALLLDDTKLEYADEPRYFYTAAAYGNEAYSQQETYRGPRTHSALEQGTSYRDIDATVRIHRAIRAAGINGRNVEIGTLNDRVTLRGWVHAVSDSHRIGEIAASVTTPQMVDNQIVVGKPVARN